MSIVSKMGLVPYKKRKRQEISLSLSLSLSHHPWKKRLCEHTERWQYFASPEEKLRQEPNLMAPWSWIFHLPELWETNVCSLSHSFYRVVFCYQSPSSPRHTLSSAKATSTRKLSLSEFGVFITRDRIENPQNKQELFCSESRFLIAETPPRRLEIHQGV